MVVDRIDKIEKRLSAIEHRNVSVTIDKTWETSWTRRLAIAVLTYIVVCSYLFMIDNENPMINGLVPALGFLLSTLALNWLRIIWQYRKQ